LRFWAQSGQEGQKKKGPLRKIKLFQPKTEKGRGFVLPLTKPAAGRSRGKKPKEEDEPTSKRKLGPSAIRAGAASKAPAGLQDNTKGRAERKGSSDAAKKRKCAVGQRFPPEKTSFKKITKPKKEETPGGKSDTCAAKKGGLGSMHMPAVRGNGGGSKGKGGWLRVRISCGSNHPRVNIEHTQKKKRELREEKRRSGESKEPKKKKTKTQHPATFPMVHTFREPKKQGRGGKRGKTGRRGEKQRNRGGVKGKLTKTLQEKGGAVSLAEGREPGRLKGVRIAWEDALPNFRTLREGKKKRGKGGKRSQWEKKKRPESPGRWGSNERISPRGERPSGSRLLGRKKDQEKKKLGGESKKNEIKEKGGGGSEPPRKVGC